MINNKILALKYRPQEFKDLIGQEVMTQTITNAIKLGKTPNAYLLTGIRGVGKTTTARLIAKALNCFKNSDEDINCSSEKFCDSCIEIINSNHMDILEMDAASKTGIDDIRELIENAKYSPTSAKFKIFIIDEVHMLSKQAFNGLLKTLEEPPPRLKFILATTEVKKIPEEKAWKTMVETFVNYDQPLNRYVAYGNDMGAILFVKYWLRIQRAGINLIKEKPLNAGMLFVGNSMLGLDIETILDSNLITGNFMPTLGGFEKIFEEILIPPGVEIIMGEGFG